MSSDTNCFSHVVTGRRDSIDAAPDKNDASGKIYATDYYMTTDDHGSDCTIDGISCGRVTSEPIWLTSHGWQDLIIGEISANDPAGQHKLASCGPLQWYDYYLESTRHMVEIDDNIVFEVEILAGQYEADPSVVPNEATSSTLSSTGAAQSIVNFTVCALAPFFAPLAGIASLSQKL